MKKFTLILLMAVLLAGGTVAVIPAPVQAQVYEYPPPPADPYAYPWVGPSTPWVYYNGDWFLNGLLYYFFGPDYGWAPYYAYPTIYIVRPSEWYAPRWLRWYKVNPVYWENFTRVYPYWRGHRQGQSYNERFYEDHHRGQGKGPIGCNTVSEIRQRQQAYAQQIDDFRPELVHEPARKWTDEPSQSHSDAY